MLRPPEPPWPDWQRLRGRIVCSGAPVILITALVRHRGFNYCRSCKKPIREVLILASSARRTNLRIQESHENYFYNSATI